jgi:hypothetical protein
MSDRLTMAVVQRLKDLLENFCSNLFSEELVLDNPIEELATPADFSDQIDVPRVFEIFVELEDVGVVEGLQDGDFLLKSVHVLYFLFGHLFHSSLLPCHLVLAKGYHSVSS